MRHKIKHNIWWHDGILEYDYDQWYCTLGPYNYDNSNNNRNDDDDNSQVYQYSRALPGTKGRALSTTTTTTTTAAAIIQKCWRPW